MLGETLPGRRTICGLDELGLYGGAEISHILSILDPGHPEPPEFQAYGDHHRLELRFHDVIEEAGPEIAPGPADIDAILGFGRDFRDRPAPLGHLLVHCHMGISRSTAALTLLLAQARPDLGAEEILGEIVGIRDKAWPNLRMIEIGDAALGRGGALIRAVPGVYHWQLTRRPHLEPVFSEVGRGREIAAARAAAASLPGLPEAAPLDHNSFWAPDTVE